MSKNKIQQATADQILSLSDQEVMLVHIVTTRVTMSLDKISQLDDNEQKIVDVTVLMVFNELKKMKVLVMP